MYENRNKEQEFIMRKNKWKLGLGVLTVLATPIAVNTVAGTEAHAAQGWVQSGSSWYFYNNQLILICEVNSNIERIDL